VNSLRSPPRRARVPRHTRPRVLRNTPYCWRPNFFHDMLPDVGHSFLARDSETYTRRGISGIHFLAYYCILTVHPLDPRSCATWLRVRERIKDQDRRACVRTRVLRAYACVCTRACLCMYVLYTVVAVSYEQRARAHETERERERTSQLCWLWYH